MSQISLSQISPGRNYLLVSVAGIQLLLRSKVVLPKGAHRGKIRSVAWPDGTPSTASSRAARVGNGPRPGEQATRQGGPGSALQSLA